MGKRAWNCPHTDRLHYAHGLCKNCYRREWYARPEVKAKHREYQREHNARPGVKEKRQAYNRRVSKDPWHRTQVFLLQNRDCTSMVDEITALYSASVNVLTGKQGNIGQRTSELVLDHVHGGPAIGLIPSDLNKAYTKYVQEHWDDLVKLHNLHKSYQAVT